MAIVITTIQPPSAGVFAIAQEARRHEYHFFVIGDQKSPRDWEVRNVDYLSFRDQMDLPFALSKCLPANTYSRKMLGYLMAARCQCNYILETDDDNIPYKGFYDEPTRSVWARIAEPINSWVNIYSYFTNRFIWPRGFPLELLHDASRFAALTAGETDVSGLVVVQALADGDPDVDAVYRLSTPDPSEVRFEHCSPLLVPNGSWSPFNSQATTWPIELLPLMYLPATCSFRMTDIWRSFIVQRLLPSFQAHLLIVPATVFQERNSHDLMADFAQEIEGYTRYMRFIQVLEAVNIRGHRDSVTQDLRLIYLALIKEGFFQESELALLDAWITDVKTLGQSVSHEREL